jgi:hypothetical protein
MQMQMHDHESCFACKRNYYVPCWHVVSPTALTQVRRQISSRNQVRLQGGSGKHSRAFAEQALQPAPLSTSFVQISGF